MAQRLRTHGPVAIELLQSPHKTMEELMYHMVIIIASFVITIVPPLPPSTFGAHCCGEHGMESSGTATKQNGPTGPLVCSSKVENHQLSYHMIDIRKKMKALKTMDDANPVTHHLMVYVKTPQGESVGSARVGFLVKGPNGKKQMLMAMGMGGGYGADIDMSHPGAYEIKTKIIAGNLRLIDQFSHEIK